MPEKEVESYAWKRRNRADGPRAGARRGAERPAQGEEYGSGGMPYLSHLRRKDCPDRRRVPRIHETPEARNGDERPRMNGKSQAMKISPSKENYLKVMLELSGEGGIRSIDIANALGVSKASVCSMMNVLRDEGYVAKEKYGTVTLTEAGKKTAGDIKRKYELLKKFLHDVLGVEAAIAAKDACRMEHLISPETTDRMECQLERLSK